MVLRIYLPLSVTGKLHCAPLLLLKRTLEFVIWSGPRLGKVNTYFFLSIHRVKVFHLLLIQVQHRLDVRLIPSNYRISLRTVGSLCMTPVAGADLGAIMDHVGWKTSSSTHHYIKLNPVLHPCGVTDTLDGISSDLMERSWVLPKLSLLCTAFFSY